MAEQHIRAPIVAIVFYMASGFLATTGGCNVQCTPEPPSGPPAIPADAAWFEDVAQTSGLAVRHTSGHQQRYWFPEISGSGVTLCDFDDDGFLDVYFIQGRPYDASSEPLPTNRLLHNRGDGTFVDITAGSRVGDTGYGMGGACGDYDNDGDVDLYVTNVGANVLYRNDGQHFTDVTGSAGVGDSAWSTSSSFLDYDADGDLDLFVTNYIGWTPDRERACTRRGGQADYCAPNNYSAPLPDTLYRNEGDGTFTDVSEVAGLRAAFGNGLGTACADFNGDDRTDIYVANDGMKNQLWINSGGGRFTEEALLSGCAVNVQGIAEAGMGVSACDFDQDGDLDLFLTHLRQETNTFYVNSNGAFTDATTRLGLASASQAFTGFGVGMADFNHDGWLDIYVANGSVIRKVGHPGIGDPYAEPNLLFLGVSSGRFEAVKAVAGTALARAHTSRAAALGDLNNDGAVDIVVTNKDDLPYVLLNSSKKLGNWIMLDVRNRHGSPAIDTVVDMEFGGRLRRHVVQPGFGYCSSSDPRVHCGLGTAEQLERLTVRWSDGTRQVLGPMSANRMHTIRRP